MLIEYDKILIPFKKVINRRLNYLQRHELKYYGNTEGSLVSQDRIFTGMAAAAYAKDGNNIQVGRDSWGSYRGYEEVLNHEQEIEEIGKIAEDLLEAKMLGRRAL